MTDQKTNETMELRPNIFQIPATRPGSHVYLIRGETKNLLIDTGMAQHAAGLKACLAELALSPEDIHLVILTHEHFDHVGAAPLFHRNSVIAAHRLAANKIQLQDEFVMLREYFDTCAGNFGADLWLEDNMTIELGNYRFTVIHTPGHCSGCICLYEPNHQLLFTGDTVLAGGLLSGVHASGNVSDYINSLQRLSSLRITEFYPGHGRISYTPEEDIEKATEQSLLLLENTKTLFSVLDTSKGFATMFAATKRGGRKQPPCS